MKFAATLLLATAVFTEARTQKYCAKIDPESASGAKGEHERI
jgi:hypothetical protein